MAAAKHIERVLEQMIIPIEYHVFLLNHGVVHDDMPLSAGGISGKPMGLSMNPLVTEMAVTAFALAFLALLLVCIFQKKSKSKLAAAMNRIQEQHRDLSQRYAGIQEDLARKKEIADKIPVIVRRFSETLPPSAIPPIAVRFSKDFFHASQVGYFVPGKDSNEFVLVDGAGYPPDLMTKLRVSADEGILGTALQRRVVVSREDPLVSTGRRFGRPSLEGAGLEVDFVAPVFANSKVAGALVLAGCRIPIDRERPYVSMVGDLVSAALQSATTSDLLEASVSLDELTGLHSRRYFAVWFEKELRRAKNYSLPLSLFLFDIDHFKRINDTHGHHTGDLVLKRLGDVVRRHTRSSDLVARYGGEEFVVVMTSSNKEQAFACANNLRETIGSTEISIPGLGTSIGLTISGGVASFPADGDTATGLLQAADHALYGAKRKMRNEVVLAQPGWACRRAESAAGAAAWGVEGRGEPGVRLP